jgi:hypothetical protein
MASSSPPQSDVDAMRGSCDVPHLLRFGVEPEADAMLAIHWL